jgi:hypothetical protein
LDWSHGDSPTTTTLVSSGPSLGWAGHSTATDGRRGRREPASTSVAILYPTSTPPSSATSPEGSTRVATVSVAELIAHERAAIVWFTAVETIVAAIHVRPTNAKVMVMGYPSPTSDGSTPPPARWVCRPGPQARVELADAPCPTNPTSRPPNSAASTRSSPSASPVTLRESGVAQLTKSSRGRTYYGDRQIADRVMRRRRRRRGFLEAAADERGLALAATQG